MAGRRIRRALARITVAALALATPAVLAAPNASADVTDVIINEFYARGGSANQPYTHKFVELYNPTSTDVSLAGTSIQYRSATGTSTAGVAALSGTIRANGYFLVQLNSNGSTGVGLPTPDATSTVNPSGTTGTIFLANTITAVDPSTSADVIDKLGYGGSNSPEGTAVAYTGSNSTPGSLNRTGFVDTDDNAADFTFSSEVTPQNSGPVADDPPFVVSVSPSDGGTGSLDGPITVTFSEPVNLADGAFSLTCPDGGVTLAVSGGPTTYALTPTTPLAEGDTCLFKISAAAVADVDGQPDTMTEDFTSIFTAAATLISQIQGSGATTPLSGQTVTVEAVVTAIKPGLSGFYLQEEDADADGDPATSEGIFVFGSSTVDDVAVGDLVRVSGTVGEFTSPTGAGSSQTQLSGATVTALDSPVELPTVTEVTFPLDSSTELEQYEGMLVQLVDQLVISEYFDYDRFGEVVLAKPLDGQDRLHTPTAVVEPGPAAIELAAEQALRIITLDDYNSSQNPTMIPHPGNGEPFSSTNGFRGGDTITGVIGVIDHTFGRYRIQPTEYGEYESVNGRPADAPDVGGTIQVASFNVLNYFLTIDDAARSPRNICGPLLNQECRGADSRAEFERQRAKILEAIDELDADVVGLMEMENSSGVEPAEDLVEGLNDLVGADTYAYIDTGVIGTDAIRLGFLYKPANVTPVGDYAILDSTKDSRFDDTRNRPMLTQTFDEIATGGRVTVSVNHLKSKGSACAGDPDTGDGSGNCNLTRLAAAQAIADFLATDPTGSGDPDHLVIGDLNSYDLEDPIDALVAAGYTDLVKKFGGELAYGYVFDGKVGYLDHALSNETLTPQVTGAAEWHINADEPDILDYNLDFGRPATFFTPDPYRSSDHDPVLVGLNLNVAPTVEADFGEGFLQCGPDNASLTIEITDPNVDDTHTVTVDWGDGTEPTIVGTDEPTVTLTHTYAEVGTYTATVTVMDSLGETAQTTAEATVAYDTDGLGGPFKNGAWTAKNGSTVPVKVEFRECDGSEPTDLDPTITVSLGGQDVLSGTMRFTGGHWQYQLRTRDLAGPGLYTVTITVPETGQTVTGALTVRR